MMRPKLTGRWIRWSYVAPRLIVVALVVVCVRYGLDPVLRWAAVASGEASLGAKVEIGALETRLRGGKVTLEDLLAANPQSPMKNLFEAKSCQFEIDVKDLFHKRLRVKSGEIAGIQFDTPRSESGALEETLVEESTGPSLWDPLSSVVAEKGGEWFDGVEGRLDEEIVDQLKSPRLAKELEERWPQQYKTLESQVDQLRDRVSVIEQEFRQVKSNPLRNLDRIEKLSTELQSADGQFRKLAEQIQKLPQQAQSDRDAVLAARSHDEALLREKLQINQLDGDQLSYYLLGKEAESNLASVVGWLRFARRLLPSNKAAVEPPDRGTFVSFERVPRPEWLVEQVRLLGSARLGGEPIGLTGVLSDLASQPQLHARPAEIRLASTGSIAVQALVQMDRRGDAPLDTLVIDCPALQIPGRTLGKAEKFALTLPPSPAALKANVRIVGEALQGTIVFNQSDVHLQPTVGAVRDAHMTEAITSALAQVDGINAEVVLSGSLDQPGWKLNSNLGPQLASGFEGALRTLATQKCDRILAKAQQQVDRQIARIDEQRQAAQEKLLARLGENQQLLAALGPLTGGKGPAGAGTSLPRLGRALVDGIRK